MQLDLLEGAYAIAQLPADAPIPDWAYTGDFVSITRTPGELSIVCRDVPAGVKCQRGWRCLKVRGPLDFSLTGVLASIAEPLAQARVSIFAVATFDTDYILVPETGLERALSALSGAGHQVMQ